MSDLLIRNVPDALVETYEARAKLNGRPLEDYVRDVLAGIEPAASVLTKRREELIELTKRNLSRFPTLLKPMARREFREGFEE